MNGLRLCVQLKSFSLLCMDLFTLSRDQLEIQHYDAINKIEAEYMNFVQDLLIKKSKIMAKLQFIFYQEIRKLNNNQLKNHSPTMYTNL